MTIPSLVEIWEQSARRFADRPALAERRAKGEWDWLSYAQVAERVDRARSGLAQLGIKPGERVAILSDNRLDWVVSCYAIYGLEAALVPMYEAQLEKEWEHILRDSEAVAVLASRDEPFKAAQAMRKRLPALREVIGFDLPPEHPQSFSALLAAGEAKPTPARHPAPDTIAGFFYTSGTTGLPKGVVLSHANLASNLLAVRNVFPLEPGEVSLSFLPWAHSFGQVAELHYGLSQGMSIAINDEIPNLLENLSEIRPTILVAVPRIFNRIYRTVMQQIAERPAFIRRLFYNGLDAAAQRRRGENPGFLRGLELKLDDRLIFSKIRERFGGRLRFVISGSAALNPEVAELIDALGIPVYEGYGLSETSPVVSVNTPRARKMGSVGRVIPGVRVEIDESRGEKPGEGEIIVYGPNVMRGYHNRPEENEAAFTSDGGLRTGDLGYLDDDGFLFITGRIKEQYKLANGKYVMPGPVEEELKLSPYIANIMVHGDGRSYNIAIVVPDRAALEEWAKREGIELEDPARDRRVRELLLQSIESRRENLRGYELPRKILVVTEDFSTENGLLTPTLKLKRREVLARYRREIDALYAGSDDIRVAPPSPP